MNKTPPASMIWAMIGAFVSLWGLFVVVVAWSEGGAPIRLGVAGVVVRPELAVPPPTSRARSTSRWTHSATASPRSHAVVRSSSTARAAGAATSPRASCSRADSIARLTSSAPTRASSATNGPSVSSRSALHSARATPAAAAPRCRATCPRSAPRTTAPSSSWTYTGHRLLRVRNPKRVRGDTPAQPRIRERNERRRAQSDDGARLSHLRRPPRRGSMPAI